MKKKGLFIVLVLCFILPVHGYPEERSARSSSDRTDIEVTIYNNDIGLVSDTREVDLKEGEITVQFPGIPPSIIPESVKLESPEGEKIFSVLEQSYEYDLVSPQKLVDKYVGKKIKLEYDNPKTGKRELVEATILSNSGGTVLRIGDEITFDHPGRMVFPELPEDLVTVPRLSWLLDSGSEGKRKIRARYLTRNISWKTDYSLVLDNGDETASFSGWVTIDNRSGAVFQNAKLRLVAGDIHLEAEMPGQEVMVKRARPAKPRIEEKKFFEYHMYDVKRRTSIKNNHRKQIQLLDIGHVAVKKRYILKGNTDYYYSEYRKRTARKEIDVFIEMINDQKSGLGIPLPQGLVRVYKKDGPDTFIFIGEDSIDHTPENETIKVKTGSTFDIVSERKQTDWVRIAEGVFESTLEVTIRNHQDVDAIVTVMEPVPGDWRVLETTHDFRKTSSGEVEFDVAIPSRKETVLRYRIRVIL